MNRPCLLPLGAALLWTAGCANAPAEPPPPPQRVLLTLGQDLPYEPAALAAFEARASQAAGAVVRHVAGVSARVHLIDIRCATPVSCEDAMARLRADAPYVTDARLDGRKRIPGG